MTMRFSSTIRIGSSTDSLLKTVYYWFDFMRTASPSGPGWTVPRSSNGSTGGAGDNISSYTSLNNFVNGVSRSWFVLRSPDLGGGRYKELLWYRINTTNYDWACRHNKTAVGVATTFDGGDVWNLPTATGSSLLFQVDSGIGVQTSNTVIHIGADDAAPFGFWFYDHYSGNFASPSTSWALLPITTGLQPNDEDPYVFLMQESGATAFWRDTLQNAVAGLYAAGCRGFLRAGYGTTTVPGCTISNTGGDIAPYGMGTDDNGDTQGFPIMFAKDAAEPMPNGLKGWTDFALWQGSASGADGKIYNSGTLIQWSSLLWPWNGSVPEIS